MSALNCPCLWAFEADHLTKRPLKHESTRTCIVGRTFFYFQLLLTPLFLLFLFFHHLFRDLTIKDGVTGALVRL